MDVDGPQNDKGLYAIVAVQPADVHPQRGRHRVEHLPRQARRPDPRRLHVAGLARRAATSSPPSTIPARTQSEYQRRKNPGDLAHNYYVANFKDYRFLQVFYPTRGILAWYSRAPGISSPCPAPTTRATSRPTPSGAPTASTWSSPAPKPATHIRRARRLAERANDPNETQVRYDLYRMPFNDGQGRQRRAHRRRLAATA